jgi:hypothetical protein
LVAQQNEHLFSFFFNLIQTIPVFSAKQYQYGDLDLSGRIAERVHNYAMNCCRPDTTLFSRNYNGIPFFSAFDHSCLL